MKTDEEKERLREIRERVQPPPETPPSSESAPEGDADSPAPPSGGQEEPSHQAAGEPDRSSSDPPAAPVDTAGQQYSDEEIEGDGD
jgi:hypothetical protein